VGLRFQSISRVSALDSSGPIGGLTWKYEDQTQKKNLKRNDNKRYAVENIEATTYINGV